MKVDLKVDHLRIKCAKFNTNFSIMLLLHR